MTIREIHIQLTVAVEDDSVAYDFESNIDIATADDLAVISSKIKHEWYRRITHDIIDYYREDK